MRVPQAQGVAAGPVQMADDLAGRDPQLAHRGFYVAAPHPTMGDAPFDSFPVSFSATPPTLRRSAPTLGQDNERVFAATLRCCGPPSSGSRATSRS